MKADEYSFTASSVSSLLLDSAEERRRSRSSGMTMGRPAGLGLILQLLHIDRAQLLSCSQLLPAGAGEQLGGMSASRSTGLKPPSHDQLPLH